MRDAGAIHVDATLPEVQRGALERLLRASLLDGDTLTREYGAEVVSALWASYGHLYRVSLPESAPTRGEEIQRPAGRPPGGDEDVGGSRATRSVVLKRIRAPDSGTRSGKDGVPSESHVRKLLSYRVEANFYRHLSNGFVAAFDGARSGGASGTRLRSGRGVVADRDEDDVGVSSLPRYLGVAGELLSGLDEIVARRSPRRVKHPGDTAAKSDGAKLAAADEGERPGKTSSRTRLRDDPDADRDSDEDDAQVLALSDLLPRFPRMGEQRRESLDLEHTLAALTWLARFHAYFMGYPAWAEAVATGPSSISSAVRGSAATGDVAYGGVVAGGPRQTSCPPPLEYLETGWTGQGVWTRGGYSYVATRRAELADIDADSPWAHHGLDGELAYAIDAALAHGGQAGRTLVHGDCKAANMAFGVPNPDHGGLGGHGRGSRMRAGGGGGGEGGGGGGVGRTRLPMAMFDMQYVGAGVGASDLAKLLATSVDEALLLRAPPVLAALLQGHDETDDDDDDDEEDEGKREEAGKPGRQRLAVENGLDEGEWALLRFYWLQTRRAWRRLEADPKHRPPWHVASHSATDGARLRGTPRCWSWGRFVAQWKLALVDWARFQAGWGFWGNEAWLRRRCLDVLERRGWKEDLLARWRESSEGVSYGG